MASNPLALMSGSAVAAGRRSRPRLRRTLQQSAGRRPSEASGKARKDHRGSASTREFDGGGARGPDHQLDDLRKEGRTKEAQLAHERKQLKEDYEKKLAERTKAAETWESRYREGTTERALLDAAVSGDAFNTDTLMAVLRPMTQLSEITDASGKGTGRFEVKVDFPDTDPNTGEPIKALHTPQSAVKRMKELPIYVNLFKSGVVSGAGANARRLDAGQRQV